MEGGAWTSRDRAANAALRVVRCLPDATPGAAATGGDAERRVVARELERCRTAPSREGFRRLLCALYPASAEPPPAAYEGPLRFLGATEGARSIAGARYVNVNVAFQARYTREEWPRDPVRLAREVALAVDAYATGLPADAARPHIVSEHVVTSCGDTVTVVWMRAADWRRHRRGLVARLPP
jgi:hypothetical protein